MPTFVQISVNVPAVSGVFDYHLPDNLEGKVGVGHLVTIPFGHQVVQGVVFRFVETPAVEDTKSVIDLLDALPVLTSAQITLAEKMAEQTLNPIAAMMGMMLPSGLSQQADLQYSVIKEQYSVEDLSQAQKRILALLQKRGALRGRQIDRHFKHIDWKPSAQNLVKRGILASKSVLLAPKVRPKFIRTAQLAVPPDIATEAMLSLGTTEATQTRRAAALQFLMQEKEAVAVSWVYAESHCNIADLQILAKKDLIVLRETEIWRDPVQKVEIEKEETKEWDLTNAQEEAMNVVHKSFADSLIRPILLHGITGSGKTEIYIRAAQEAIKGGGQALILVPEIALTPQTVRRFLARFPGQVGLIHSKLSPGERYDTWRRARAGQLKVIIGARSALFAPLPNIKLIVLDEFHDGSYHQTNLPFYDAVRAAESYAEINGAVCILGSATPPIEYRYQAALTPASLRSLPLSRETGEGSSREARTGEGAFRLIELPERIGQRKLPPVDVIDMRTELKSGNRGIFSRALQDALSQTLARGEQAILFLNRRGTATYVFCRDCGYSLNCPRCETPLTLHTTGRGSLRCHRCNYTRQMPKTCPECKSTKIRAYGLGSEKVEDEVNALFPDARVLRWDWDTTRTKDAHELILSHFTAHRADVLVGTQMLAKGLDLPLVTLVGVVLADVGLNLPDPFAAERVFQTLTQVAGRAGRSARGGRVLLQTFEPEHYVVQHASKHDYANFYTHELEERRRLGYPPFANLVRLEYRHRDPIKAEEETNKLAAKIKNLLITENRKETTVIGPVPCFFAKMDGIYRWQIILRGPEPETLLRGFALSLSKGWRVEVNPVSLL
ncbi:MAG: primosomal protein N' [Chloroflexi bacterium]|nr:primosomal protein N' [Chloroflexota bacterium]